MWQPSINSPFLNTDVTKDHPLTQVRRNPSKPVQTRRQLVTDPEMCMFALTVSIVEPKNIKEAMADSAWIEAMQEELHQFDRLQVWELVDKPFGKNVIKLKCYGKTKRMKTKLYNRNKARLVSKGLCSGRDADHSVAYTRKALWRNTVLGDKLGQLYVKEAGTVLNSSAEANTLALFGAHGLYSHGYIPNKMVKFAHIVKLCAFFTVPQARSSPSWLSSAGTTLSSHTKRDGSIYLLECKRSEEAVGTNKQRINTTHHFQLAINSGVVSSLATRKVYVHGQLRTISTLTVCSGLVNPLAPRKGKFHGGLRTISTVLYMKLGELMNQPLFGKVSTI
ncbi:hypothetical protein Tco_0180400 [Tanacetum coccineum]